VIPRPKTQHHQQPGERGYPVILKNQSTEETELRAKILEKYGVDHFVSDKISVHRSVGEHRHPQCISKKYDYEKLKTVKTSIIIAVFNEGWMTLLRTIYSILHTTPEILLEEVIIIDDFSSFDYLGAKFEEEISKLSRVKLVRNKKREGLIRTRIIGSKIAKGKTITFLDCHIECNEGWLEPLLGKVYSK